MVKLNKKTGEVGAHAFGMRAEGSLNTIGERLRSARESKGLSFEVWYTALRQSPDQFGWLFTDLTADRYTFTWTGYPSDWPSDANFFHVSHSLFDDTPGRMQGRFYNNGLLANTNAYASMAPYITKGNTRLVLAPGKTAHDNERPIPGGIRFHAFAIYRRPLNAAEMRQSFLEGPPAGPSAARQSPASHRR